MAKGIGACNTIIAQEDGKLKGYNTDVAAIGTIESALGPGELLKDKTVVVIGAGGAAKAVAFAANKRCV